MNDKTVHVASDQTAVEGMIAAIEKAGYRPAVLGRPILETEFDKLPAYACGPGEKRALGIIDAQNDFGSETHCRRSGLVSYGATSPANTPGFPRAMLPVAGGEEVGPVIGKLQVYFAKIQAKIFGSKDWHPEGMFNFASKNPAKKPYVERVKDESGRWAVVYPDHCLANSWGAEYLPGIHNSLIDRIFFKGTSLTKDYYSVVKGNKDCVKWLRKQGITHIDLTGLVFRICVAEAAIGLSKAGFKVRVIVDATRDLPIPAFERKIAEMIKLGVEFVTSEQVLAGK